MAFVLHLLLHEAKPLLKSQGEQAFQGDEELFTVLDADEGVPLAAKVQENNGEFSLFL